MPPSGNESEGMIIDQSVKRLAELLARILPDAPAWHASPDRLPAAPGSYVLVMRLDAPPRLSGRWKGQWLDVGWLLYCGSARGPGGLRARLARHLRREKPVRWHVDQLTTQAALIAALPFSTPQAPEECALAARLLASGAFDLPLPGFGSSDCRKCESHLLRWRAEH